MIFIPTSPIPNQRLSVVLNEQECNILLRWQQIRLYLDLSVAGQPIRSGMICQDRVSLLGRDVLGFNGFLFFGDTAGFEPPHWEGLESRYFLMYFAPDEPWLEGFVGDEKF